MSVVKINALDVPAGNAEMLEQRFAQRAGEVETMPGFEGFELLRPSTEGGRYFVYTRWESEEAFQAWVSSRQFDQGHARSAADGPAASGSELLSFEVVMRVEAGAAGTGG